MTGTGPSASVIVTNYNYGRFLRDALDSALSQSIRPEVVVVDDGSTDDSPEIIASYGSEVLPVLKENGGQTSSFNAGLEVAGGDVVVFLDADDILLSQAIERLLEQCAGPDVAKAHWQMRAMDEQGEPGEDLVPPEPLPCGDLKDAVVRDGPAGIDCPPTSGNAWMRGFLDRIFPLPDYGRELAGGDAYMTTLAPMFGRVVGVDEPLSVFRRHGASNYGARTFDVRLAHDRALHDRLCEALERLCTERGLAVDRVRWDRVSWVCQLHDMAAALRRLVPPGRSFILIDDNLFDIDEINGRRAVPLIAKNGVYWGAPEDDAAAIAALDAQVLNGLEFLALAPTSSWWLDSYPQFFRYVEARADVLVRDTPLTLYRLYPSRANGPHVACATRR